MTDQYHISGLPHLNGQLAHSAGRERVRNNVREELVYIDGCTVAIWLPSTNLRAVGISQEWKQLGLMILLTIGSVGALYLLSVFWQIEGRG